MAEGDEGDGEAVVRAVRGLGDCEGGEVSERCHKCGRVLCETCGGCPRPVFNPFEKCPDCDDGWRDEEIDPAAVSAYESSDGRWHDHPGPKFYPDSDPSVLCPKCQHAQDEAVKKELTDYEKAGPLALGAQAAQRRECGHGYEEDE